MRLGSQKPKTQERVPSLPPAHSVYFPFLCLFLHFWVIFCVCRVQCWVINCQKPVISSSKLPYNNLSTKGLACGLWLPPAANITAKWSPGLDSVTMWYDGKYVPRHIGEISILWVRFILLAPPVSNVQWPRCTANLHWVGVVIIEIRINLPPVLWRFRRWIQIELDSRQSAFCAITPDACRFSPIVRP